MTLFTPLGHLFLVLLLLIHLSSDGTAIKLDHSNLKAFDSFMSSLGASDYQSPCSYPGVLCEKGKNTYVLKITRIVFNSRGFSGVLSSAIGRLSDLRELSLPNNLIVDQIPSSIMNCRKLEILDLGNNSLSGKVPVELQSLVRLKFLDLSFNKLTGHLHFLENLSNLEKLSLENNLFSGKVPKSVRNRQIFSFSGKEFLKELEIEDDESRGSHNPKRYVLVENSTTVEDPTIAENSTNAANSAGNHTIAGPVAKETTYANSTDPEESAEAPSPQPAKKKNKLRNWILGFVAGGFAGIICGLIFSFLVKLVVGAVRGGRKDTGPAIYTPLIKREYLAFLERDDGLESLEIIGSGGCGQVYRASLPGLDNKMIAIKKIVQPPTDTGDLSEEDSKMLNKKMRQIRAEITTVGRIRHKNLLPLLAHVARSDCHYLVYEYMKNGSLLDVLKSVSEGTRELDWLSRHKIALGIAAGLEYLHSSHTERIIHRDLKPANILLDDNMEARIADFGLAKQMSVANTHVTTSNVAGTVGYIAPEYHQSLKFTDKCDIYSFGVVLGALVVGKQPSDEFFHDTREMSMVKWMRNIMASDCPTLAIDSSLIGFGYEEQILLVLKIACFCTMDDPKQRPNSKQVRLMLAQIEH